MASNEISHNAPSTLAEFYQAENGYGAFDQQHRCGGSYDVSLIRACQDAHDTTNPAFDEFTLWLSLKSDMRFRWNYGDGWSSRRHIKNGDLSVCPINTDVRYECDSAHDIIVAVCSMRKLQDLLDDHGVNGNEAFATLTERVTFRDPEIRAAIMQIWTETRRQDNMAALLVDGLWQSIVGRALRHAGSPTREPYYGLKHSDLRRLDEYLDAHQSETVTTRDLARLFDLPIGQFSRDFKEATGNTVYQYVLKRRLSKAKQLLVTERSTLSEIAYDCGFSSQSHMTDVFRAKLGITPGRLRASAKG